MMDDVVAVAVMVMATEKSDMEGLEAAVLVVVVV